MKRYESLQQIENDHCAGQSEIVYLGQRTTYSKKSVCFRAIPCIPGVRVQWRYLNGPWETVAKDSPKGVLEYASLGEQGLVVGFDGRLQTIKDILECNPSMDARSYQVVEEVDISPTEYLVAYSREYENPLGEIKLPVTEKSYYKFMEDMEEAEAWNQEEAEMMLDPERYFCTDRR